MAQPIYIAQFIHQSVNDFLLKGGFACIAPNSTEDIIGRGHHQMARSCLNYLRLQEVSGQILTSRYHIDAPVEKFADDFPLIVYAASAWFLHAAEAEKRGFSQVDLLRKFQWPSSRLFRLWIEIFERVDGRNHRLPAFRTSLLHIAADSNLLSVIQEMLKHGVDIDEKDSDGKTALDYAYRRRHHALAGVLLEAGAAFDDKTTKSSTPLERASSGQGYEPLVKFLLEHGADVNAMSDSGGALQCAAKSGNISIVQLLLDSGADVNAKGGYYGTAIQAAAAHSHYDTVQLLLDYGAATNTEVGLYGNPLQAAAASTPENVRMVRVLLERGANVHLISGLYGTALSAASFNCHDDIVQLFLDHGADINENCGYYGTALQAAAASEKPEKLATVIILIRVRKLMSMFEVGGSRAH